MLDDIANKADICLISRTKLAGVVDWMQRPQYHARPSLFRTIRGIAQSGSAPALGAGCREFESLYPDQFLVIAYIGYLRIERP